MKVLITAGQVYGRLDANKLVGNRTRGIWAVRFAEYLLKEGHEVVLVVSDIMDREFTYQLEMSYPAKIDILRHDGFWKYKEICEEMAPKVDAAVMASAVVNWIPETPFPGKMPITSKKMSINFILAPKVINKMKKINPKLALIGCKMLIGSEYPELINAAHRVIMASKANLVLANDMKNGLKTKYLVYQDKSVFVYENDFQALYEAMKQTIEDKHYSTNIVDLKDEPDEDLEFFKGLIQTHKNDFIHPSENNDIIFGAVAVKSKSGWIITGRGKSFETIFEDYGIVKNIDYEKGVVDVSRKKVSLNAPLMIKVGEQFGAKYVVHFHTKLPYTPIAPYAPPGTFRDNNRDIPGPVFNIEGHGYIKALK